MSNGVESQKINLPLVATKEDCFGRTFIVTGANTGLGREAARHFVALGATKVILGCRSIDKGQAAKDDIEASTETTGTVEVWELDLSKYSSVKVFAKRAIDTLDRIDVLVENAAVALPHSEKSEGHETPVTVNVLSTFLLAALLLPKMSQTARRSNSLPHLTVVGSRAGFSMEQVWKGISNEPLVKIDGLEPKMATYPMSKIMAILAVRHVASLVPVSRTGVVINVVCPGLCVTELSRNAPEAFREQLAKQHAQHGRTAEDGSRTLLHGAVAAKDSHGHLLHSCEDGEYVSNRPGHC